MRLEMCGAQLVEKYAKFRGEIRIDPDSDIPGARRFQLDWGGASELVPKNWTDG
jgi:hypothetical protein